MDENISVELKEYCSNKGMSYNLIIRRTPELNEMREEK